MAAITPAAHSAGSTISANMQDNLVGALDQTAVEQIIENLLSNAVRYGDGEPIEVTLDRSTPKPPGLLSGIMASALLNPNKRAFSGNFREAPPNRSDGGFGVGLWITRQLVTAMRGEISVSSELGSGSTFTVELPLQQG